MTTTNTISILTQKGKVIVVKVKREQSYSVPPAPSECVNKGLGALKSLRAEYPPDLLARQRAAFVAKIQNHDADSDGLWKKGKQRKETSR